MHDALGHLTGRSAFSLIQHSQDAFFAKQYTLGISGFTDPIRVQQQRLARLQDFLAETGRRN
jgi:hypothetical protein